MVYLLHFKFLKDKVQLKKPAPRFKKIYRGVNAKKITPKGFSHSIEGW